MKQFHSILFLTVGISFVLLFSNITFASKPGSCSVLDDNGNKYCGNHDKATPVGCWCDTEQYGDNCEDIDTECPEVASQSQIQPASASKYEGTCIKDETTGEKYCGDKGKSFTSKECWCDTPCEGYTDCCTGPQGYLSVCKNGGAGGNLVSPSEEEAFNIMYSIDLSKGENIIGYPLEDEISVENLKDLCPLESSGGYYFWTYNSDKGSFIPTDKLQPGKAYRVNSNDDCSIQLFGKYADFKKLSLSKGWNLITPPKLSAFNNVLGTCKGKLDDEQNVLGFDDETKNQIQKSALEPGKAYWIFAKSNCELDFSSSNPVYTTEGQIKEMSFYSNALKENRKYNIYLPSSYYTSSNRYAVLYLFHGAGGDNNVWIIKHHIDELMKKMTKEREIEDMILVMPDIEQSGLENGCSGLGVISVTLSKTLSGIAQPACGKYEDFIVNDLIPHIDSTYRTVADKSARGFLGFSTGAHGAYWIAFRHPDLVSFVAGYSGFYQTKYIFKGPIPFTSIDDYRIFREVKIPPKNEISHMTLYLEVGKYDIASGAGKQTEEFHNRLKKAGIPHTYVVTPAGNAIKQFSIHGYVFLSANMYKAIALFSNDIVEPIHLVKANVPD